MKRKILGVILILVPIGLMTAAAVATVGLQALLYFAVVLAAIASVVLLLDVGVHLIID